MKRISILMVILLTACAADQLQLERNKLSGKPEEYKDGYVDGCSSGNVAAGAAYFKFQKDPQRFEDDKLYAQGWGDGFAVCKANHEYITRMTSHRY